VTRRLFIGSTDAAVSWSTLPRLMRTALLVLILSSCAAPSVTRVRLQDLPGGGAQVVYALPKSIVRVQGALARSEVEAPPCDDRALALSLGLEREKPSTRWSVSNLDLETYTATDFDQLYAVSDESSLLATRKVSLQLTDTLALTRARQESTSTVVDLAKAVFRLGAEAAGAALAISAPPAAVKFRGGEEELARTQLCHSAAQSLQAIRAARLELLSQKSPSTPEALTAALDKLASLEEATARLFTGTVSVTRLPFECRVDPGQLPFVNGAPLDVHLVDVDPKAGKLIARGAACFATDEAWATAGEALVPLTLRISPTFVSTAAQRAPPAASKGLVYRIPAQADLALSLGPATRQRKGRPIPQLGIVASLPASSLTESTEIELDPATGGLRRYDSVRASAASDLAASAAAAGDSATAVRKSRGAAAQEEVDALDLELKRLRKARELQEERAREGE
jgi:hypothetical protein